jgi:hypothetical protein
VYTKILQQRLKRYTEEAMSEEQAGFRRGRGTMDQIFVIRQLSEKHIERNRTLYNNFIDYKQAFDSVWQEGLWKTMRHCGIREELVILVEDLYSKSVSAVRVDGELTEWFKIKVGVRQGCGMSSDLFNLLLEIVMRLAKEREEVGVNINGRITDNLRFADDVDLIATTGKNLQELTDRVDRSSKRMGLKINVEKTKTMTIGKQQEELKVKIGDTTLEQVTKFVYLGGVITAGRWQLHGGHQKKVWIGLCSVRRTEQNVEDKKYLHQNQNEIIPCLGRTSVIIWLRMLVLEERG